MLSFIMLTMILILVISRKIWIVILFIRIQMLLIEKKETCSGQRRPKRFFNPKYNSSSIRNRSHARLKGIYPNFKRSLIGIL